MFDDLVDKPQCIKVKRYRSSQTTAVLKAYRSLQLEE